MHTHIGRLWRYGSNMNGYFAPDGCLTANPCYKCYWVSIPVLFCFHDHWTTSHRTLKKRDKKISVTCEVGTAVTIKMGQACSLEDSYRRFTGTCSTHHQGWRMTPKRWSSRFPHNVGNNLPEAQHHITDGNTLHNVCSSH